MTKSSIKTFIGIGIMVLIVWSCANIGSPQGGPIDTTPPKVVSTTPAVNALNYDKKKIIIRFNKYIKLDNASENVMISPPQNRQAEISVDGKTIQVKLLDSLKANSTYSIDFSNGITDNNEGNPLGNYAFTFSTGNHIDTMEVSGYIIDAQTLEPVKGIEVGLHSNLNDSAFIKLPFDRVGRTDSRGHFVIKGIAPGKYHIYALKDANQTSKFSQRSEAIAFNDSLIVPWCKPDIRQDTTWVDSLTYDTIIARPYTHYYPENVILRLFTENSIMQYLKKSERNLPQLFTLSFAIPNDTLPRLRGLNFNEKDAFIIQKNAHNDTIQYWIRDSTIYKLDTLKIQAKYMFTDTLNRLVPRTDTLQLYVKKFFNKGKTDNKDTKKLKKGEKPKVPTLPFTVNAPSSMDIFDNIKITFQEPVAKIDTSLIHLWEKADSVWKPKPYVIRQDSDDILSYNVLAEWNPGMDYDLKIDTLAFKGIYGLSSSPSESKLKLKTSNDYANLFFTMSGLGTHAFVVVTDASGKMLRKADVDAKGHANIYYLAPGKVYAYAVDDKNGNSKWDTGDYDKKLQPECVYYFPHSIELKAMWDIEQNWNVKEVPLYKQKPDEIKKQKPDEDKKKNSQNQRNGRSSR